VHLNLFVVANIELQLSTHYFILCQICLVSCCWSRRNSTLYFGGTEGGSVLKEVNADQEKDTVLSGSSLLSIIG